MFGPVGSAALGSLAGGLLKSSVVLTLALAAAAILRRKPAALRHFVLSAFLISLLLLPLLSLVPGGWQTSLLPRGKATPVPILVTRPAFGLSPLPTLQEVVELVPAGSFRIAADAFVPEGTELAAARRFPAPAPGSTWRVLGRIGLVAWAAGLLVLLLRLGLGLAGAARLTKQGRPVTEPAWRILLARFLAAVSLRRDVRLRSHDAVLVPLTWGLFRPVILLPRGTEGWTEDQRSTVLCHELSHIKRADFLVTILVRMSLALAWPNPLTWIVFGMLRRDQEKACDEMVLRTGLKPSVYAAHLLSFRRAAGRRFQPAAALLGLFGRSSLQERLAAILGHRFISKEVKMKTKLVAGFAIILAAALVGTARPAALVAIQETEAAPAGPAVAAAPARASQPAQAAAAAKPAEQEEKEKAKAKAEADATKKPDVGKPVVEKKIIVTPAGEKKGHIEIVITEGDVVKTLVADKPVVIIRRTSPDKELIISSDGKELMVGRSGDVRIEIKGGDLKFIKEGEALDIAEGQVLTLKTSHPEILILKDTKAKGEGDLHSWVTVEPDDQAADRLVYVSEDEGLEKKLEAIREQLQQVKENKLALEEVEKSLDALTESVKKHPRAYSFSRRAIKVGEPVSKSFTIVTDKESASTMAEKIAVAKAGSASVIVSAKNNERLALAFTTHPGKIGKEVYDRTVTELKQALPEGCTLESEFTEDSGTIVVKVKGPKLEKDKMEALVEKLASILKKAGQEPAAVVK